MSYQVLSRKYRPQLFEDIIGQSHISQTLQNAIRRDRVGHGYLFTGPRGVGKTTAARLLAKSLNCVNYHNDNPCNRCIQCQEITDGRNLDVLEIDGASNRGINDIRELREVVKYPPTSAAYKIYIIDEVHMLTREAFNALLKTLEEPPPHVIFIMATTDPHKIPQTILSRTQRFDFKRMSVQEIVSRMITILKSENIPYEENALTLIATKGDGSMRDSLSLLDQVIAYTEEQIETQTVQEVLGIVEDSVFRQLLMLISDSDDEKLLLQLNEIFESGYAITDFIRGFNQYLRSCLLALNGLEQNLTLADESREWLENDQFPFTARDLLRMMDLGLQFENRLRFTEHPRIAVETLFLKLSAMDSTVLISELLSGNVMTEQKSGTRQKRIAKKTTQPSVLPPKQEKTSPTAAKAKTAAAAQTADRSPVRENDQHKAKTEPITAEKPEPVRASVPKDLSLDRMKEYWPAIYQSLENWNTKTANFLEDAKLTDFTNNVINILLVDGSGFELRSLQKDRPHIESIIKEIVGKQIRIQFEIPKQPEAREKEPRKMPETDHPLMSQVIDLFNGEVIR